LNALESIRRVAAFLAAQLNDALFIALTMAFLVALLRELLRREWLVIAAVVSLFAFLGTTFAGVWWSGLFIGAPEQVPIRGQPANAVLLRNGAPGPELTLRSPEEEMLHRPLGEVLSFGDALRLEVPLDDDCLDTTEAEFNGESHPHRPPADNQHLSTALSRRRHARILA
jgi:hypothetical protein